MHYSLIPRLAIRNKDHLLCCSACETPIIEPAITTKILVAFQCEECYSWNGVDMLEFIEEET